MAFLDISQLGEPHPSRNPDEIQFCCVYCGDEHYHLYVNIKKNVFHCFKCGASGKTNATLEHISAVHLTQFNYKTEGPPLPIKLPPAHPNILPPLALKHLVDRNIYESDVKRHTIYAASPYSKYFSRLILPYHPKAGFASYFVARSYTGLAFPKYLNPPGSKKVVFFSPQIPDVNFPQYWGLDELVLVEGVFDMVKASRHGPSGAILGKELKHNQARVIVAGFSRVYLLLDNDLVTKDPMARTKMRDLLELHIEVKLLDCPCKDPGEMVPEDFKELFT